MIAGRIRAICPMACIFLISIASAFVPFTCAAGAQPAPVTVSVEQVAYKFTDEKGENLREMMVQEIVLENEYIRATILPGLGGRIARVFDKSAEADMFFAMKQPIPWNRARRFSAYNSQLGGIVVNFPCFHHGNSFSDNWNWQTTREADGTGTVVMAWTDKYLRQRVVLRVSLRPGSSLLTTAYRYANLNPFATGFAPWVNTMFPYNDDPQWIIPTQHVVPHGFNDGTLEVRPWPWPEFNEDSICFWRNMKGANEAPYISVFALDLQGDFCGVYYHELDRGTARIFDRREQPGVKLWHLPPSRNPGKMPRSYFELWSGPALVHEDARWWEGYAVREYRDAWLPVHGIGGYRLANEHGAVNLVRKHGAVELGVCPTHPVPGAVVSLVAIDGTWWRTVTDLGPGEPLRHTLQRDPGRMPLELRVTDAAGRVLIRFQDQPDPGLRRQITFAGKPLWRATPERPLLRQEQYHPLWRGQTGGYRPLGAVAAPGYRRLLTDDPGNLNARLGLARTLMVDAQLRGPDRPGCGTAEQVAADQKKRLEEALEVLAPVLAEPAAAILAGEIHWRLGDAKRSTELFAAAGGDAIAQFGLARALAKLGRIDEAASPAESAARALPGSPPAAQLAAGIAILRGRHAEALEIIKLINQHDPLDPVTLALKAMACRSGGNADSAASLEQRVRELELQTDEPISLPQELDRLGLSALPATLHGKP